MDKDIEQSAHETKQSLKRRVLLGFGLPLWVLIGFILSALAIGIVDEITRDTGFLGLDGVDASLRNTVIAGLVYVLTLIIVIGIPYKWRGIQTTKEELGFTRLPSWMDLLLAPACFLLYILITGILLAIVTELFPGFDAEEAQEVGFEGINQYYEYVLAFITLVVLAPVAEEVLVRGYLYGKLRKITSVAGAVIITSLLFSLMHFQWNVAISVLPLGIILAMLRESTGSIWASILLHMIKNGIAYYLLFVNTSLFNSLGG
jgi:membrane protease YdiL (CAAX protease family)